jgi:hypothetical protein
MITISVNITQTAKRMCHLKAERRKDSLDLRMERPRKLITGLNQSGVAQ